MRKAVSNGKIVSPLHGLGSLFAPRAVAVIGASADVRKFGGRTFWYLTECGFAGEAYAVSFAAEPIGQRVAYPSVAAIGRPVDLAILAIPIAGVEAALEDCAAAGVRAAVIYTSGFSEAGADGAALQARIDALRARSGMRILGPNCIGLVNTACRFAGTFATMWEGGFGLDDGIAVVSQSGAMASYLYVMLEERGLGVRYWCSTGNESDIDVAECIGHYAADPEVKVILACLEGLRDGPRLLAALESARAHRKPVVLLKVGSSDIGKQAAQTHTAALAGDAAIFAAAIQQSGAVLARSFDEMVDIAVAAAAGIFPSGRRLGIVSGSGGAGVLLADMAAELGLEVPEFQGAVREGLDRRIKLGSTRNPVDVTAAVMNDIGLLVDPLTLAADSGQVDATIAFLTSVFRAPGRMAVLQQGLRTFRATAREHPVLLSLFASPEHMAEIRRMGFPTFVDPTRAIRALAALMNFGEAFARPLADASPASGPPIAAPPTCQGPPLFELLAAHGLRAAPWRLAASVVEAQQAADALGYPVAMKTCSPHILHKTEAGGVIVGLSDAAAVAAAFDRLRSIEAACGGVQTTGVLVQRMVAGVGEVIVGARRDPVFGAVVLAGIGGILAEAFADTALRLAPVSRAEAKEMIGGLKGAATLRGLRGRPPADLDALARLIAGFSDIVARLDGFGELEMNPVIVGRVGEGCWIVDARLAQSAAGKGCA